MNGTTSIKKGLKASPYKERISLQECTADLGFSCLHTRGGGGGGGQGTGIFSGETTLSKLYKD